MKICDCLSDECIICGVKAKDKWSFFKEISAPLAKVLGLPREEIEKVLEERERLGTTAIGHEIALPHSRLPGIDRIVLAVAVNQEGINFEALDRQPVKLVFVVLAPENESQRYLKILAQLARLLKDENFRQKLLSCQSPEEIKKVLSEVDYEF